MTKRTDSLTRTIADLNAAELLFADAERRMMDARPALPGAASYEGMPGGGGSRSSVEALAMQPDPTQRDRDAMDRALRQAEQAAATLLRLAQSWQGRAPTARDQAEVERANDPTPECLHCREDGGKFEPFRTITDVGGVLAAAVPLCRWHTDFTARVGRKASQAETEAHCTGRQVRVPA